MTKNTKGGKGAKKRARKYVNNRVFTREMIYKKEDQEYGRLTKALGCCRFTCLCSDGKERIAHIPGSLHFIRFRVEDIVLVSLRISMGDKNCDICYKYNPSEFLQLQEEGLLSKVVDSNELLINEDEIVEEIEKNNEINIDTINLDDI